MAGSLKVINKYFCKNNWILFQKQLSKLPFLMIKTKICSYTYILELIKSRSICYKNSYSVLKIIFSQNLKECNQYHCNWKSRQYLNIFTEQCASISYFFMSLVVLFRFLFFFFWVTPLGLWHLIPPPWIKPGPLAVGGESAEPYPLATKEFPTHRS